MWEYWFEAIVIFMLLGISGRIYKMGRELSDFHDCFHHFEEKVFNPPEEIHVDDGRNLRVMGLEEFMDEFGFDPRKPPMDEGDDPDNRKAVAEWDNKL